MCVCAGAGAGRPVGEARRVGVRGPDAADRGGLAVGTRSQVAPLRLHPHRLRASAAHHLPLAPRLAPPRLASPRL